MNLNDFFERIPLFNRVSSVLVCEVDFTGLKAAVISRKGHELSITFETRSDNPDFNAAVAEVAAFVRANGWHGKTAALLSPAVMLTLLELPIATKNKLAPKQLAEQIQYELEPLINQHLGQLTIGRLLVAHGVLTEAQLEDVLNHQADLNSAQNTTYTGKQADYMQFGEVAESLGFLQQSKLKDYLTRQAAFKNTGDDLQVGWAPQGLAIGDNAMSSMHHWLASAVNKPLLRQWQAAFTAQGLKLSSMYPLVGCAAGLLSTHAKNRAHQLLIEATPTSLAGVHIVSNQVHGLHVQPNSVPATLTNASEAYHLLPHDEVDQVLLADATSANAQEAKKLHTNLERSLQKSVRMVQNPALAENNQSTLGMLGVARHVMRMKGAGLVTGVSVHEPQPPLMQHIGIRAALAGLALLGLIGVAEGVLKVRESLIERDNAAISTELKKLESSTGAVQAKVDEIKKLKDEIKKLKNDKKEVQASVDLLTTELPKRSQLLITLLNELANATSDDVVVNKLTEDPVTGFTVEAWAINEKSAQEFVKEFQFAVQKLGFKLRDITVAQATGRLGLMGYSVDFSATVLPENEWQAQKELKQSEAKPLDTQPVVVMPNQQVSNVAASPTAAAIEPPSSSVTQVAKPADTAASPTTPAVDVTNAAVEKP